MHCVSRIIVWCAMLALCATSVSAQCEPGQFFDGSACTSVGRVDLAHNSSVIRFGSKLDVTLSHTGQGELELDSELTANGVRVTEEIQNNADDIAALQTTTTATNTDVTTLQTDVAAVENALNSASLCPVISSPSDGTVDPLCVHGRAIGSVCGYSCDEGYVPAASFPRCTWNSGTPAWTTTASCTLAACPADASGGPTCVCDAGFKGTLTWNTETLSWDGTCFTCTWDACNVAKDYIDTISNAFGGTCSDPVGTPFSTFDLDSPTNLFFDDTTSSLYVFAASCVNNELIQVGPDNNVALKGNADVAFGIPFHTEFDGTNRKMYLSDYLNHYVEQIDLDLGTSTHFAGIYGAPGHSGDGFFPTSSNIWEPQGLAYDSRTNKVYLASVTARYVREFDIGLDVADTYAGNSNTGSGGDGELKNDASFGNMFDIEIDETHNMMYFLGSNSRIRRINMDTGLVETIANVASNAGYEGDGFPALYAKLSGNAFSIAVHEEANKLYIADTGNHVIRVIDLDTMIISTFAGLGAGGSTGDGGLARTAKLSSPKAIYIDNDRNIMYIADTGNDRVRVVGL